MDGAPVPEEPVLWLCCLLSTRRALQLAAGVVPDSEGRVTLPLTNMQPIQLLRLQPTNLAALLCLHSLPGLLVPG